MDDLTLIAASKTGLETLLSITEEFYLLNNTATNHKKYMLVSTQHKVKEPVVFSISTNSGPVQMHSCLNGKTPGFMENATNNRKTTEVYRQGKGKGRGKLFKTGPPKRIATKKKVSIDKKLKILNYSKIVLKPI